MDDLSTQYLTRDQAYELLVKHGFPIGKSTLDKLCAPAVNRGPPIAAMWPGGRGRNAFRPLYEPAAVLAWAQTLLKAPTINL
jgi:hypothetical protein